MGLCVHLTVLGSVGIELIFFLVPGMVLCFGFRNLNLMTVMKQRFPVITSWRLDMINKQ